MNPVPTISIVTPSYNQGEFIEETIRSVLGQEYEHCEYIVIDGASTDTTLSVIEKYKERITHWKSEPDGGQAHAINKGFQLCTGEVIGWLNSDDTYLPGTLSQVSRVFASDPSIDFVYGDFVYTDKGNNVLRRRNLPPALDYDLLLAHNYVGQPTLFFRRRIIEETGGLDESLRYVLDWDFVLTLAGKYRYKYIAGVLATYRIHRSSKTSEFGNAQFVKELNLLRERHKRSGQRLGVMFKWRNLAKRIGIILHDGIGGFVRFYVAQHDFSLRTIFSFLFWRIRH